MLFYVDCNIYECLEWKGLYIDVDQSVDVHVAFGDIHSLELGMSVLHIILILCVFGIVSF